ncbi:hypothetical protein [Thermoflavimicrobium dichotomicum]|nr:hypothetical protein [Thermoflavimicrobium dichotomicum]
MWKKHSLSVFLSLLLTFVSFDSTYAVVNGDSVQFDKWFSPYSGDGGLMKGSDSTYSYLFFGSAKWTANGVSTFDSTDCWEYEARMTNPDDFFRGVRDFVAYVPDAYYEYESGQNPDDNDVTIGSHDPDVITAEKGYSGTLYLEENGSQSDLSSLTLESEYGETDLIYDCVPTEYESFGVGYNTKIDFDND